MPTVSIVTTVYNREQYLAKAIESFLAQTYADAELLIWDDGSTDRSVEIAQSYAKQNSRITIIAAEHLGRGEALRRAVEVVVQANQNRDMEHAYLGLLDSDDVLAFNAIEETIGILEANSHFGMVYTDYYEIDPNGNVKRLGSRCKIPYSQDRLLVDFMTFHFRLLRLSIYEKVGGFDPTFSSIEDYDLCLKVSEVTQIYHLAKPLYYYRLHSTSLSCEKQLEQIQLSQRAVLNALQRRGLDQELEVEVRLRPQFVLRRKQP